MKVTICSSLRARKSSRFCSIQLVAWKPGPAARFDLAGDAVGVVEVVDLEGDDGDDVGLGEEALGVGEAE